MISMLPATAADHVGRIAGPVPVSSAPWPARLGRHVDEPDRKAAASRGVRGAGE